MGPGTGSGAGSLRFNNLPELLQIFRMVADVQTEDMLPNIERPSVEGGKPTVIVAQPSEEQKEYVKSLVRRADRMRKGGVDPTKDNMLKVTSDGRKAALDMRLIEPTHDDHPDAKVNLAVRNIHSVWLKTAAFKGTQLIFCDMSTPKKVGFNVYTDMRDKLVKMGIPEQEIAFIHSADTDIKKKVLFYKVNSGSVRILFGSTEKMGTGMNVQKRSQG